MRTVMPVGKTRKARESTKCLKPWRTAIVIAWERGLNQCWRSLDIFCSFGNGRSWGWAHNTLHIHQWCHQTPRLPTHLNLNSPKDNRARKTNLHHIRLAQVMHAVQFGFACLCNTWSLTHRKSRHWISVRRDIITERHQNFNSDMKTPKCHT